MTTAVAVVAVLIAGLVSLGLVRSAGDADARRTLSALADAAAEGAERTGPLGRAGAGRQRTRTQLTGLQIDFTFLTRHGRHERRTAGRAGGAGAHRAGSGPRSSAASRSRSPGTWTAPGRWSRRARPPAAA